jgi:hypothetical protein
LVRSVALNDPDMKILWSRSAGLCAFPDCREILVRFSKTDNGLYQIGEQAHLIARSLKGPRGKGLLALDARDSYENHILLCPTCHAEIDTNQGDYPIDRLAAFKLEHEHWVAETLLEHLGQKAGYLKFYSDLLANIERLLLFDRWTWLIDHLWRDLAPTDAIDSVATVRAILLRTIWPGNKPRFEAAIKKVMQSWSSYCENFMKACRYHHQNADFMVSSHVENWMSGLERSKASDRQGRWSNRNGRLLIQYVRDLNRLVNVVREELLPTYRQEEGHFLIHDDLGYRNHGESIIIKPAPEHGDSNGAPAPNLTDNLPRTTRPVQAFDRKKPDLAGRRAASRKHRKR